MVVVASRSPAVVLLLLAALLLACTATGNGSSTICDTALCGKGSCSEVPLIPGTAGYKCTCDPGWSQPLNLTIFDWLPCMIPDCTFDSSCYNFSFLWTLPKGIPVLDPCVAVNCGSGECKKGDGWNYTCDCQPGYYNFLSLTGLPCMNNYMFLRRRLQEAGGRPSGATAAFNSSPTTRFCFVVASAALACHAPSSSAGHVATTRGRPRARG